MRMLNKGTFTGVEIEAGYIKLAQAKAYRGSRKILKLKLERLGSSSAEDIEQGLRRVLLELKGKLGQLTICIPRHKVTVRFLEFPSVNEKEIAGMVRLQSTKELPFSKEELVNDYLITGRSRPGYTKVALVIAHQDMINDYLALFKKIGLQPERITFSTEAILDWHQTAFKKDRLRGNRVFIDLDSDNTDIVIFTEGHLNFTRGLSFGWSQLEKRPDLKNKLATELKQTIKGHSRGKQEESLEKILLVQNQSAQELKLFLEQEFNLPCELVSPLKGLTYQKKIAAGLLEEQTSLLRILGAVLGTGRRLNLLPGSLQEKQALKLRKKTAATAFFLSLAIILLTVFGFVKKFYERQLYLSHLSDEIRAGAPQAKTVENMFKKIILMERRLEMEGSSVDLLRLLHRIVPEKISLSIFTYDETGKVVTLQGSSSNMSEIFNFMNTLEKTEYFQNVQLKYVSEKKARAGGITDFKIECNLEK